MRVILLDQNKWIELSKAELGKFPQGVAYLDWCLTAVQKKEALFPLNWTHIYETQKINNVTRRINLSRLMVRLSGGKIFKPRLDILISQLQDFYSRRLALRVLHRPKDWFLSDSVSDLLGADLLREFPNFRSYSMERPAEALMSLMSSGATPDVVRLFSYRAEEMIKSMEERRLRWKKELPALQRRAHSAMIFFEVQDVVVKVLWEMGVDPFLLREGNGRLVRAIMEEVPLLRVERDMAFRIELEPRPINENDLRDFSSFCTAFSLGCDLIGEKAAIGRLVQTGLPKKNGIKVFSDFGKFLKS